MNDQADGPAEAADLIETVGQRLWSVMPEGARELHFVAVIHDDSEPGWELGACSTWVKEDGSRGFYSDPSQRPPYALEREVIALLRRLRGLAPFRREPWTHAQVTLAADGRVRADFAYVDRDDEWANLYMRGASELTLEEAGQNFIPAPDWAEKPRRAMLRLETKAAALEATSLFEDAVRVGAQLEPSGGAWRPTNELDGAEGSRPTQRPPRVENGLSTSHPPSTRREPGRSIR